MSGTKAGAAKAVLTNKKKNGEDHYSKIGSRSWVDPARSHETGFAKMPKDVVKELARKGGKKKKNEYKTPEVKKAQLSETFPVSEEWTTAEEIHAILAESE